MELPNGEAEKVKPSCALVFSQRMVIRVLLGLNSSPMSLTHVSRMARAFMTPSSVG